MNGQAEPSNPAGRIRPAAGAVPRQPGCYLFSDQEGHIIYVGKAKDLRDRTSSYFAPWHSIPQRTRPMLQQAAKLEWMVTGSESEALHLEWNLIRKHRPRYNIRFRDDKSYPEIVITVSQQVPRARISRSRTNRHDRRFGPYTSSRDARATLDLLLPVFPVRTCGDAEYRKAERTGRPCLLRHIGRCAAPCTGEVSHEEHRRTVRELEAFLGGDTDATLATLEARMHEAAEAQNYEAAARLRDRIASARRVAQQQHTLWEEHVNLDAIAFAEDEAGGAAYLVNVRRGRIVGRDALVYDHPAGGEREDLTATCLLRAYQGKEDQIPPLILTSQQPPDVEQIQRMLGEVRGQHGTRKSGKVRLQVARRGRRADLIALAARNAEQTLRRARLERPSDLPARTAALQELQKHLGLDTIPTRIECFDVSHLSGTRTVGAMVSFEDGEPAPERHRRYRLTTDRNDDPGSIRETVHRRLRRLLEEGGAWPHLIIVDGGPQQLDAALQAAETLDAAGRTTFVALAKRLEELWLPHATQPIVLPEGSEALHLVQRIRDEAHRTAITFQRKLRREDLRSSLEDAPGIGPKRRAEIMRRFGSLAQAAEATDEQLLQVPGVTARTLPGVREKLAEATSRKDEP